MNKVTKQINEVQFFSILLNKNRNLINITQFSIFMEIRSLETPELKPMLTDSGLEYY